MTSGGWIQGGLKSCKMIASQFSLSLTEFASRTGKNSLCAKLWSSTQSVSNGHMNESHFETESHNYEEHQSNRVIPSPYNLKYRREKS